MLLVWLVMRYETIFSMSFPWHILFYPWNDFDDLMGMYNGPYLDSTAINQKHVMSLKNNEILQLDTWGMSDV